VVSIIDCLPKLYYYLASYPDFLENPSCAIPSNTFAAKIQIARPMD